MQTTKVSTKDIMPSPYNMRRTANDPVYEQKLHDLIKSISEKGILQPITVRRMNDHYETVFGNRRLEAAKRLKIASVDVQIGEFNDDDAFLANMTENIQRQFYMNCLSMPRITSRVKW